jgi:hypothetical protein
MSESVMSRVRFSRANVLKSIGRHPGESETLATELGRRSHGGSHNDIADGSSSGRYGPTCDIERDQSRN